MAATLQAQHTGDLPQRDLNTDPGQESDQHGAREEVRQKSQAHEARQNQETRGHQCKHAGQCHVLLRTDGGNPHHGAGKDRRRRRIGAHHKVPRGAEQSEQRRGDEHRIETRDQRGAGDLGVAHYFRDGNCGKRDTGKNFGRNLSSRDRQHPLKDREAVASGMIVC